MSRFRSLVRCSEGPETESRNRTLGRWGDDREHPTPRLERLMDRAKFDSTVGASLSATCQSRALHVPCRAFASSFVEPKVIRVVSQPIEAEFRLCALKLSAPAGFLFAVLRMACVVPNARRCERRNRAAVLSSAMTIRWLLTTLC